MPQKRAQLRDRVADNGKNTVSLGDVDPGRINLRVPQEVPNRSGFLRTAIRTPLNGRSEEVALDCSRGRPARAWSGSARGGAEGGQLGLRTIGRLTALAAPQARRRNKAALAARIE